jgi:2-keto-4-pentenoate hydratase/2-oxohepta-3-ene-1,7-dioic acid hydratase in catechol pathway
MKPAAWLVDGDLVEIEIERIGKIANKMVFEK